MRVSRKCAGWVVALSVGWPGWKPSRSVAEPLVLQYDSAGNLVSEYEQETKLVEVKRGKASVQALATWKTSPEGNWADPVQGRVATSLEFRQVDTGMRTIADFGKVENVQVSEALGLDPELARADMVAAAVRRDDADNLFYEWDLALPAKSCVAELATACLPSEVCLLSAAVRQGKLYSVVVTASPDEWRRAGVALRSLRSSLRVEE